MKAAGKYGVEYMSHYRLTKADIQIKSGLRGADSSVAGAMCGISISVVVVKS